MKKTYNQKAAELLATAYYEPHTRIVFVADLLKQIDRLKKKVKTLEKK